MRPNKMFLAQGRLNEAILYCIMLDVVLGFILKKFHGPHTTLPLALLYFLNIVVLLAVYRFWKVPLFEWDEAGCSTYGLSPYKKVRVPWSAVAKAGFQLVETKRGKIREFLVIISTRPNGGVHTSTVPMDLVAFRDKAKKEFLEFLRKKKVQPL